MPISRAQEFITLELILRWNFTETKIAEDFFAKSTRLNLPFPGRMRVRGLPDYRPFADAIYGRSRADSSAVSGAAS